MKKLIIPVLFLATVLSCSKKDDNPSDNNNGNNNGDTGVATISSVPQYFATIDGTFYNVKEDENNIFNGTFSSKSINLPNPTTVIYGSDINESPKSYFEVAKGTLSFSNSTRADFDDFKAFFAIGTYSYSVDAASGVEIVWWDNNDVRWSTSNGAANQTGSTFKITDITDDTPDKGAFNWIKVRIEFDCILYDENGNSKTAKDGVYVGHFYNE